MSLQCYASQDTIVTFFVDAGDQVNTTQLAVLFSLQTGISLTKIVVEVIPNTNTKRR